MLGGDCLKGGLGEFDHDKIMITISRSEKKVTKKAITEHAQLRFISAS